MKGLLLEYLKMLGYAIVGLVFGFSFFLLFLNFYHAKELNLTVDVSSDSMKMQELIKEKLNKVKANTEVYSQNNYHGSNSIYDMNGIQIRLNQCVKIFESERAQQLVAKNKITIKDVYDLNSLYRNDILNDCIVLQLIAFSSSDTTYTIPSLAPLRPYIGLNINNLLKSGSYIASTIENADSYFFSNDVNRQNIFNLTRDSYYSTMNDYQSALDLLVELSNWFHKETVGG